MKIGFRIFIAYFLITAGVGYYLFASFSEELKPRVLQSVEELLVDTANLMAEVITEKMLVEQQLAGNSVPQPNLNALDLQTVFERFNQRMLNASIYNYQKTRTSLRLYVTDQSGVVVFDSLNRDIGADFSQWNDVWLTLQGSYGARATRTDPDDEATSVMYVAAPIVFKGDIIGVVTVSQANSDIQPFLRESYQDMLAKSFVLAGVALILGVLMVLLFMRSVKQLVSYVEQLSMGKRAAKPNILQGELAGLATAVERMRVKLDGRQYAEHYVQTLTHEIKSPLTAIRGAAELLEEDMPEAARQKFMHNIRQETQRIQSLVNRMLDLSSLETMSALEGLDKVDLVALLGAVVQSFAAQCEQKQITVNLDLPEDAIVDGDAFLLRQACANLLANAIDFSHERSAIDINISAVEKDYCIHIRDYGVGIPDYAVDKVFDRFYSLSRPKQTEKSSGLGLSIVREVAALHGGKIDIVNAEPEGCEARFCLPKAVGVLVD